METYPHPCTRCGFCCLVEACPMAREIYGITKKDRCPALSFENGQSTCALVAKIKPGIDPKTIGFGVGCCISARVICGGVEVQFASLQPATKQRIAMTYESRH